MTDPTPLPASRPESLDGDRPVERITPQVIEDGLALAIEAHADLTLVVLAGPLDIYTVPGFRANLDATAREADQIVVDLSGVTLLDSAGLGALVGLRNQSQRDGSGQLGLICPRRRMRRIFEITGLRQAFVFGPDLPAVRTALGNERARTQSSPGADGSATVDAVPDGASSGPDHGAPTPRSDRRGRPSAALSLRDSERNHP